jgi:hypothetical protein
VTDDLVKRLRDLADCAVDVAPYETMLQAADRIEELARQLSLVNNSLEVWLEFSQAIFQQTSKVLGDKDD